MESNNDLEENEVELTQQFKNDLESFFIAYPSGDLKMCLQNIYTAYLGTESCTKDIPLVRQYSGNMLIDFMVILDNQDYQTIQNEKEK